MLAAEGITIYVVLLWKIAQLWRSPHDVLLRLVVGCLLAGGAGYPFEVAIGEAARSQVTTGPIALIWAHEIFILFLVYLLLCFFLFSSASSADARTRAWRQGAILLSTILVVSMTAFDAWRAGTPDHYPIAAISGLFLVADSYTIYGFGMAFVWVRRHSRSATRRLRHGLTVASVGLCAMILATGILMLIVALRWATGEAPGLLIATQAALLAPGIVVFIIGVSYPSAAMRLVAARVWLEHLIAYYRLRSLWKVLHSAFPEYSLPRARISNWLDSVTLRSVHRRHYRRVIEIRDGLLRLSPYIASVRCNRGTEHPSKGEIWKALKWYRDGHEPSTSCVIIAPPERDTLASDVEALIRLKAAL
jgi:hypothetical protein